VVDSLPTSAHILNSDTQAVLLLCGRFGKPSDEGVKPLTDSEYNAVAEWLRTHDMRPSDLLTERGQSGLDDAGLALPANIVRMKALLERGAALALAVEGWTNKGLWVISRSDEGYPRRLKTGRLGPAILYGSGNQQLLSLGGLAVVGSRNADEETFDFTRRVAQACAAQGIQVVSGGARGVDIEAMMAAVERGGMALGVLSDSLLKSAVNGKYRAALVEGSLALVSPYDPGAGFDVGNAMGRNRYIYALADWALVVSSTVEKGGTWAGAIEALKSGKRPVFVRTQGNVPGGNQQLLEKGAVPFPGEPWDDLAGILSQAEPPPQADREFQGRMLIEEAPESHLQATSAATTDKPAEPAEQQDESALPDSAYAAVLPLILRHLHQPRDTKSLAQLLDVRPGQVQDWLARAVGEGRVVKEDKRARYMVAPPRLDLGTAE
jgi:predicted Rossmann fold nucleotide-binding protein DprA/Smf involved in DNA uptake